MNNESDKLIRIVGYSLLFGMAILCTCLFFLGESQHSADNLIIGFFGMLATFVVIGNYTQVSHVIDDNKTQQKKVEDQIAKFEEKLESLQEKILFDNGNSKIEKILMFIDSLDTTLPELQKRMLIEYQKQADEITNATYADFIKAITYLANGDQRVLVSDILNRKNSKKYTVTSRNSKTSIVDVSVEQINEQLLFRDKSGNEIKDIIKVSNKPYKADEVIEILSIIQKHSYKESAHQKTYQTIHDLIYEQEKGVTNS